MPNQKDKESFLTRLTEIIHTHITNEQFGVNELARELGMSRSNLHRKVKSYTAKSASTFICEVRLDKAVKLLKESSQTIAEIAFECGFHSPTYFSKCYRDRFGFSPGEARNQMNEVDSQEENLLQMESRRKPKKSISIYYFLATSMILLLTIALIVWRPFQKTEELADKSIAVLPFFNDSPGESEMYFINGTMEAILSNLCKIEDLRVISRTSVEQYRDNPIPVKKVAEEMNVSYILEGGAMKQGDQVFLTIQLIDAREDKHIWSESYQVGIDGIIKLYSDVAQSIAAEINVQISPEEMKLIERVPTINQTAYDVYQKAMEEKRLWASDTRDKERFEKAEKLLRTALEFDPTFAMAYVEIADGFVFEFEYARSRNTTNSYLDSAAQYTDLALTHDPELADAYLMKGTVYAYQGKKDSALMALDRAIQLNPNLGDAYSIKGWIYFNNGIHLEAIINFYRSIELDRSKSNLMFSYNSLAISLSQMGFIELAAKSIEEYLNVDGDTILYYYRMAEIYSISGNNSEAIEVALKGYEKSNRPDFLKIIGTCYFQEGRYKESLEYFEPYIEALEENGVEDLWTKPEFAYVYLKNGFPEKADFFIEKQIAQSEDWIANDIGSADGQCIFLSMVYAIRGEKEKALENLKLANQRGGKTVYVMKFRDFAIFEDIRDDPEFQEIVSAMEAKYQAEHERIRHWLEENDRL